MVKNNFLDIFKKKTSTFSGAGQSLGGSLPGKIIEICLVEKGPLGVRVEKRRDNKTGCIVSEVVPNTQASRANLQRGDIICYANSQGTAEMEFEMFLELAKSNLRPLEFEIRRVPTTKTTQQRPTQQQTSADAYAKKQAVIAAAERRNKQHQKTLKPIKYTTKSTAQQPPSNNNHSDEPLSETSKAASKLAKQAELKNAQEFGYNPYESRNMTSAQARNAVTEVTHGSLQHNNDSGMAAPGAVSAPKEATQSTTAPPPSASFQAAFETLVTSNPTETVASTLNILVKLVRNAQKDDIKFQRVRLNNPKIQASVTNVTGAVEVLLEVGFLLQEEQDETVLQYTVAPDWLPSGLQQLQDYK